MVITHVFNCTSHGKFKHDVSADHIFHEGMCPKCWTFCDLLACFIKEEDKK
ncbi:hypothetical protein LCGC14_1338690 [marine sediment metagenome]|uniref:Uncharacterized protein n=1 Tax=marine sediment metagenome TaxID=412755 RepID=A0A0F9NGL6_9ZZZZ